MMASNRPWPAFDVDLPAAHRGCKPEQADERTGIRNVHADGDEATEHHDTDNADR